MKAPEHLSHKPIVKVDDYDKIDGMYANNSDAKALSIGNAQYDSNDLSAKVWRNIDGNWSRQSEEIPLHRVLDLAILLVGALKKKKGVSFPCTNLREEICKNRDVKQIHDYYNFHQHEFNPRLKELKSLIEDIV